MKTLNTKTPKSLVLSSQKEPSIDQIITSMPTLAPSPSLTPTPSPKPSPTNIPTPSLTPTPKPPIMAPAAVSHWFSEFSAIYGVDEEKLKRIADCESHFNPGVWAPPYAGMFQFTESTWTTYRNMMGKDPNIDLRFGAREAVETAAFALSIEKDHLWPVCSK